MFNDQRPFRNKRSDKQVNFDPKVDEEGESQGNMIGENS